MYISKPWARLGKMAQSKNLKKKKLHSKDQRYVFLKLGLYIVTCCHCTHHWCISIFTVTKKKKQFSKCPTFCIIIIIS